MPNVFSVRWFASYADLPGIEKLWYQRFETCPGGEGAEERQHDPDADHLPAVTGDDVGETSEHLLLSRLVTT